MGQLWPVAGPFRSVLHIIAAVQAASAHGLCSCLLPDVGDRILAAQKELIDVARLAVRDDGVRRLHVETVISRALRVVVLNNGRCAYAAMTIAA